MIPEIRKNCKYAAACVTSMGVRITPENRMAVHNSDLFYLQATSAESNVLNVISSLGKPCLVMTKFVEGSPIAAFIKAKLRARNISFEGPDVPQGGPWGYRHQFNIADSGFGMRAPRVWNDRAGEIGRTITPEDFDLERIFGEEGVGILHLSGLIAAMSEQTTATCLRMAEIAKQHGTLVSFDLNYRATFWKGREEELSRVFKQIASVADVLIGNEEDFQLCLGIQGPEAGGKDLASKIDSFKGMIERVREEYPNAVAYATSLRQVISANEHLCCKIAEYTAAVCHGRPCFHISLIMDVSPNCDCHDENDAPILPDIGMLASFDPVALDQACADLCLAAEPIRNSQLGDNLAQPGWHHHHDPFLDSNPNTSWRETLAHGEKIGLGTREYELIRM